MKDFSSFIRESRRIREFSLRSGAYPIAEEEAIIMYTVTFERAALLKGLNVVEVGSGCGYSSLWLLKALEDSGYINSSKMVMIEQNEERVKTIKKVLEKMGYTSYAEVWRGDAKKLLKQVDFPVHIAFLDAAKSEYHIYLKLLEPHLIAGSIVFAHNFREYYSMEKYAEIILKSGKYISSPLPTSLSLAISIKT